MVARPRPQSRAGRPQENGGEAQVRAPRRDVLGHRGREEEAGQRRLSHERHTARGALVESAPAKINLTLEIRGRRADGYHELETLIVFARIGDRLRLAPGERLTLEICGPFAATLHGTSAADNLVLRAARELAARVESLTLGRFEVRKRLPVAAGIGGGSADAAAALRLLARARGISLEDPRLFEAACALGADVPVCLSPTARRVRGIGEQLSAPL